jgi:SAM-dependent methyltransferase
LPISIFKDLLSRTGNRAFFESNAFNRLIAHECSLLKPAPGQTIAAIGSTADAVVRSMKKLYQLNNAQIFLLDNEEPTNAVLFLSDPVAAPIVRFVKVNLDFNPLIAVRQFCENEFDNFELFKGLISGLTDYTIQLWKDNLSDTLIQLLKGKQIEPKDISFINDNFPQCEADIIFDMNQAARHVLLYANSTEQQPKELNTKILKFQPYFHDTAMPFESNTFDYIHCSLILSYLNSPSMALQEMRRLLKPNGSLVISVFSAQAKISTVNNAFLDKLLELYPECLLTNNGQDSDRLICKIQELSQTMEFLPYFYGVEPLHLFTVDGLKSLLTSPRYNDVEIIEKPDGFPYALIAKCTK